MTAPQLHEIIRHLSGIPVRTARDLTASEYADRLAELYRVFGIDAAVAPEGGVRFHEADPDDTALVMALGNLLTRRFGQPPHDS